MVQKGKRAQANRVSLKAAKKAVSTTPDGRRRLDLSNAGLGAFPRCLLKLTDLDELDLSRNRIRTLPDDIGSLSALSRLDLHSNELEALPDAIGRLAGLTHLNLANNRLTSAGLPPTLGVLYHLQSLNLGLNRLDGLPPATANLTALRELGLFDNLFTKLPEIVELAGLTKLNTERNPVSRSAQREGLSEEVKSGRDEAMYLVTESGLCKPCLERCKEERLKRMKVREGRAGELGEKRKRTYSGLMMPNSVAVLNQDMWRCRMEKK